MLLYLAELSRSPSAIVCAEINIPLKVPPEALERRGIETPLPPPSPSARARVKRAERVTVRANFLAN